MRLGGITPKAARRYYAEASDISATEREGKTAPKKYRRGDEPVTTLCRI